MYLRWLGLVIFISFLIQPAFYALAEFTSQYDCEDTKKICITPFETRMIDGFSVTKDCWEYSYKKVCHYPSQNDCKDYSHCYFVANRDCLLKDSYGNCVNLQREFSCPRKENITIEKEKVIDGFSERLDRGKLVCTAIPCLDGNCVDKSYMTNGEMMDSISKLHAARAMKPQGDMTFNLFSGYSSHCSKKIAEYTNCCAIEGEKGWGGNLGAKCTKDENALMDKRRKNLCVWVGKEETEVSGVVTVKKHYYCCFGNMLDKVVQVEGRKQLSKNFGSGSSTDCRGLSMDEIKSLDFSKIDFSEFIGELNLKFAKTYKGAKPEDLDNRIKSSIGNIRKSDDDSLNKANNSAGWKENLLLDKENQGRVLEMNQKTEGILLLDEEVKKKEKLKELKNKSKTVKEKELEKLRNDLKNNHRSCGNNCTNRVKLLKKIEVIEQDITSGNY